MIPGVRDRRGPARVRRDTVRNPGEFRVPRDHVVDLRRIQRFVPLARPIVFYGHEKTGAFRGRILHRDREVVPRAFQNGGYNDHDSLGITLAHEV